MTEIKKKYLDEFSYLGDRAYLNVCSVAMQPQRTLDFCRDFQREFADSLGQVCFGPYGERRAHAAELIAKLTGAEPEEILFTENTTDGDSLLARSYPFEAGDTVILSDFDYPAVTYCWYQLADRGVKVKSIEAQNGAIAAERIIAAMDESVKVVAISWVQFMSGFKAELETIGRECRKRGILFAVDGIQGAGRLKMDVKKYCIDVFSCGGFKGMLGVFGAGFVYCRKELIPKLAPWRWNDDNIALSEEDFPYEEHVGPLPYREGIARLEAGSRNTYGILALAESAQLLLEIGPEKIERRVSELEDYFRESASELISYPEDDKKTEYVMLGSKKTECRSGLLCMNFDAELYEKLEKALEKRRVSATIREVRGRGFLRFCIHYYNNEEQLDRLTEAMKEAAERKDKLNEG